MKAWLALFLALLATVAQAETLTDSAGRSVELPAKVGKVLAAGPPASVVLYTLAPDKLLGWTRAPDAEALAYLPSRFRALPGQLRLTGRNPADPAAIKNLGADLIVDFGTVNARYGEIADRTQTTTGIPYLLVDGAIAKTPAAYRTLAKAVQAGARGEALATRSQAMLDDIARKLAGAAPKRVFVARGPDGDESYGAGAFSDEMLAGSGTVNVAAAWGQGNLKDITADKVREANPDIVIATDPYFLEVVSKRPAWQQVPAVAAGRLYVAPRHPWGWIDEPPSVNRLIGLRWLAGVAHPDRFAGDMRGEVRDFYRLFYQSELSETQLTALLAGAGPAKR